MFICHYCNAKIYDEDYTKYKSLFFCCDCFDDYLDSL